MKTIASVTYQIRLLGCLLLILFTAPLHAKAYMNVVAATGSSQSETDIYARKVEASLFADARLKAKAIREGFGVRSRPSGAYYITSVEPFYDSTLAFDVLENVQKEFPDAYIFTHREGEQFSFSSQSSQTETEEKTAMTAAFDAKTSTPLFSTLLIALVVVLFVLWVLYYKWKIRTLARDIDARQHAYESLKDQHDDVVENIGKKIREPAQQIFESSSKILQTELDPNQSDAINTIRQAEALQLDITNDMLEYLSIRSDSIRLKKEIFNINNVLDELAGSISSRFKGLGIELVFDIEKQVPARMIGDPMRLGQMLSALCSFALHASAGEFVRLRIGIDNGEGDEGRIVYAVGDFAHQGTEESLDTLFEPFTMNSASGLSGLGMYIARAIASKMGGGIRVNNLGIQQGELVLTLPCDVPDEKERRQYRLPSKQLLGRTIVIIEEQPTAAEALKKMLEYFKNEVIIRTPAAIANNEPSLLDNEMIIVAESALSPKVGAFLQRAKANSERKIVLLGNIMERGNAPMHKEAYIDARIMKPLSLQRVYDLIVDLYESGLQDSDIKTVSSRHTKPTAFRATEYRQIPETPDVTKESFRRFGGNSILVVEDNQINQKILTSLLRNSGVKVSLANDGVEALDALDNPQNHFALVLMDINMPVMDGYETTKHIRADENYDAMPIVSLTGLGLPEEIAKMYELGMNAHLIKPLHMGRLYTVFERFLTPSKEAIPRTGTATEAYKNTPVLAAADALENMGGNRQLYGEILEEFVKVYSNADQSMKMLLRDEDFEGAAKLCVDLRGVGSNIGAVQLANVCEMMLDAYAQKDSGQFHALAKAFNTALRELLALIRKFVP